jgi:predicted nucleic acid-binding protein
MLVLVDTNVLLRVVEPGHAQHAQAVASLRTLRSAFHELCVVPQVHYEFWVAATRPIQQNGLGLTSVEASAELEKLGPPLFRLLRDERAIYAPWRQIVLAENVQGKQAHDARLVAAMRRHDVQSLLTFNLAHFARYGEIVLVDPNNLNSLR